MLSTFTNSIYSFRYTPLKYNCLNLTAHLVQSQWYWSILWLKSPEHYEVNNSIRCSCNISTCIMFVLNYFCYIGTFGTTETASHPHVKSSEVYLFMEPHRYLYISCVFVLMRRWWKNNGNKIDLWIVCWIHEEVMYNTIIMKETVNPVFTAAIQINSIQPNYWHTAQLELCACNIVHHHGIDE
jgi:hypothetical protein